MFVDGLPVNPSARLLEIGCGTGNTAAYALAERKCGWCCGVELHAEPAAAAGAKLPQVVVGDIEKLDLDFAPATFDVLILSEILEHLVDPAAALRKLRPLMKPRALVMAGSPNVGHYSVALMLLRGGWDCQKDGIMDATHLRWFTPRTYQALFEGAGYIVKHVGPAEPLRWKARLLNALLLKKCEHLFFTQIYLQGQCP
jgi:2-polyprenyl-3-methyl-5-hydroxy-6-metoxy-1,4-benzoquinol methylase